VAVQGDGRVLAGGTSGIARLTTEGVPDPAFGSNGFLNTGFTVSDLEVLGDDRIVAGGSSWEQICGRCSPVRHDFVMRLLASGAPDPGFGSGGRVELTEGWNSGNTYGQPVNIELQGDSILVSTDLEYVVQRLTEDGTLDTSYGVNGEASPPDRGSIEDLEVAPDGTALVLVQTFYSGNISESYLALERFTPDGDPDLTFGGGDGVVTDIRFNASRIAAGSSEQIFLGGTEVKCGPPVHGIPASDCTDHLTAGRYGAGGVLNETFREGGADGVTLTEPSSEQARDFAVDGDGIVLTGTTNAGHEDAHQDANWFLARLGPDGRPDPDFGDGGMAVSELFAGDDRAVAIKRQPDGKFVVAGTSDWEGAVARFEQDGSVDLGFGGGDGYVLLDSPEEFESIGGIALDAEGRIVVSSPNVVWRLTADGELDTTFGSGGWVATPEGLDASSVLTLAGNRILVSGLYERPPVFLERSIAVMRLLEDGRRDPQFGSNGLSFAAAEQLARGAVGMGVQSDGRIVIAFRAYPENFSRLHLYAARIRRDGGLDRTFSEDGLVRIDPGRKNADAGVEYEGSGPSVAMEGRRILVGFTYREFDGSAFGLNFMVTRLTPDGVIDGNFGTRGYATARVGRNSGDLGTMQVVDGRLVAVGAGEVCWDRCRERVAAARFQLGGPALRRCGGRFATLVGTAGQDRLTGTPRPDVIVGRAGRDRIETGRGTDTICAGSGNDLVRGGAGDDRIFGGEGRDRLFGDRGADALFGGPGRDSLVGGPDKDRLRP